MHTHNIAFALLFNASQQPNCGREEAVKETCHVHDNAVCPPVSEVVCAVFVFEQGVSWKLCVCLNSFSSLLTALCVYGAQRGEVSAYDCFCYFYDSL